MRISHLIQTIQPDPQVLTSVNEGIVFPIKDNNNNNNNTNSWTKPISFSTDWCGNGPAGQFWQMKNALRAILKVNLD